MIWNFNYREPVTKNRLNMAHQTNYTTRHSTITASAFFVPINHTLRQFPTNIAAIRLGIAVTSTRACSGSA